MTLLGLYHSLSQGKVQIVLGSLNLNCFNFGELLKNKSKWTQKRKQFHFFNATVPMHIDIMLEIVKLFGEEHFAQTDIQLNLWLVM